MKYLRKRLQILYTGRPCEVSVLWWVFPKWAWSGSREQFLHRGLRKFRHSKSSVYRWYPQLVRSRFVCETYGTMEATRSRHGWVHMFITHATALGSTSWWTTRPDRATWLTTKICESTLTADVVRSCQLLLQHVSRRSKYSIFLTFYLLWLLSQYFASYAIIQATISNTKRLAFQFHVRRQHFGQKSKRTSEFRMPQPVLLRILVHLITWPRLWKTSLATRRTANRFQVMRADASSLYRTSAILSSQLRQRISRHHFTSSSACQKKEHVCCA